MTTATTRPRTTAAAASSLLDYRERRQEPPMFFPSAAAAVDYAITQVESVERSAHTEEERLALDMALCILREVSRMHAELTPETLLDQTRRNQDRSKE